jgi:hypothetical protein
VIQTSTVADSFDVRDIYKVENALNPRWRPRARWVGALPILNLARQFLARKRR